MELLLSKHKTNFLFFDLIIISRTLNNFIKFSFNKLFISFIVCSFEIFIMFLVTLFFFKLSKLLFSIFFIYFIYDLNSSAGEYSFNPTISKLFIMFFSNIF